MNKINLLILSLILLNSCVHQEANIQREEDDTVAKIEELVSEMGIVTNQEILNFNSSDSISIVIGCQWQNKSLCSGYGEIHYVIDDSLEVDRIFEDTSYKYNQCWCDDTIYLSKLNVGKHFLNGHFYWHKGNWSFGKKWNKAITIN